jgi:hypothetical protein
MDKPNVFIPLTAILHLELVQKKGQIDTGLWNAACDVWSNQSRLTATG